MTTVYPQRAVDESIDLRDIAPAMPITRTHREALSRCAGGGVLGEDHVGAYARHLRHRRQSPQTIAKRAGHLRMVELVAGPLLELTTGELERFIDTRRGRYGRPLGDSAHASWVTTLRGFYRWAVERGLTDHDPAAAIAKPRVSPGLPRPIPEPEYQAAIAQAAPMMRAWLLLGGYAGLRCGEIARLEGEHVDHAGGVLRIHGKGDKWRTVPAHRRVLAALETAPRRGPVFRRPSDGGPFRHWQVSHMGAAHLHACGSAASMHQLRHRFATRLYELTGDLALVAELLGHANVNTSRIYARLSDRRRRDAIDGLE